MKARLSTILKFSACRCYRSRFNSIYFRSQFARIFVILSRLRGSFVSLFAVDCNFGFIL